MNKKDHFVIIQSPNLPLVSFIVFTILAKLFNKGTSGHLFEVIAFGSIFTWAWLEIFSGVNYFRRILGLIIIIITISSAVQMIKTIS
jgi:hypothetical protein